MKIFCLQLPEGLINLMPFRILEEIIIQKENTSGYHLILHPGYKRF